MPASASAERRDAAYQKRKQEARTGQQLLHVAWARLLSEMTRLKNVDPGKADQACRALAPQIEQIALDTAKEADR